VTDLDYARARERRRRQLHQRQTAILGILVLALVSALLVAWLMWLEILPSPFARDFNSPPPDESSSVACPPEGATTVSYTEIMASVWNSTNRAGLAGGVATTLAGAGVAINQTGNWDEMVLGVGFMRTGVNGLEEAYTLAQSFPGMIVTKDAREDALVDIVLGYDFQAVGDLTAVEVGVPIPPPQECLVEQGSPAEEGAGEPPAEARQP